MSCDLDQGRSGNMRRSFRRRRLINLNGPREVRALLAVHPSMRFARVIIRNSLKINMKSYTSGRSRRRRGHPRRRGGDGQGRRSDAKAAPQKKGFWSRIAGFFAAPEKANNAMDPTRASRRAAHINRSRSRSPRHGSMWETCHSMRRRATCSTCSTASATSKTPRL